MNVTHARVGDHLRSFNHFDDCPVGTRILGPSAQQYQLMPSGLWARVNNGLPENEEGQYRANQFSTNGSYSVFQIPEGWVSRPRPPETIEQYMWRFRDRSLAGAVAHGVSYSASAEAIVKMGVTEDRVPIGAGVLITNTEHRDSLPVDTIVASGQPDRPGNFGVFVRGRRNWQSVLGVAHLGDRVKVVEIEGSRDPAPWLGREGTDEDAEQIRLFRGKAWEIGWELKRTQSWCGTYEQVMRDIGLTATAVREARSADGLRIGDTVDSVTAHRLPEGTVLKWTSSTDPNQWAFYVRCSAGEQNQAGTVRVGGTASDGRNYRSSMTVVALPENNERLGRIMAWDMPSGEQAHIMDAVPAGAVQMTSDGSSYVKGHDGRWIQFHWVANAAGGDIPASGRYTPRDFGENPVLSINRIIGVSQ